ncbi:MAG: DegT/DnrJ/EryC1/StrS family aminotransferase [Verrucomicrobia bacterium]|nr:DegT/DnrJ/EryC1/StrS family aminotransferase [Verrucomicrobiota bacterium]
MNATPLPAGGDRTPARATRRRFLAAAGATAVLSPASLSGAASGSAPREKLALQGGPKAVTLPPGEATRWPVFGEEEERAVLAVLRDPGYAPIPLLESEWKEHFRVPFARAYCNGTSALTTMFFALDLPPGSEILVPSYTFFSTVAPMRFFGLVPVFVDIDPHTLNLDVDDARRRLTKHTRAILPVHFNGLPCEMDRIGELAREKGLIVLENACHADGATLQGRSMGSWGSMAAFSFQFSKPLPTIEGGLAVYHQREYYERGSTLADTFNQQTFAPDSPYRRYNGSGLGLKLRIHPMSAALARVQLRKLDRHNADKLAAIRRLNDRLRGLPGLREQSARADMQRTYFSWNLFLLDEAEAGMSREACVKALKAEGVPATAHVYTLQHKLTLYAESQWWHHLPALPELPASEKANRCAIALPRFTRDSPELVDQYVRAFEKVWAHRRELGSG